MKTEVYRFGDCELDADRRELKVDGKPVTSQPKAFELLLFLIRNRHRAVDKDELQDVLWPRSIVTETALTRCIMKARRAVNDDANRQAIIKTIHGHGYRFVAEMADEATIETPAPKAAAAPRTERNTRLRLGVVAAALVASIAVALFYLTPTALSGPVRLAVLPVDNATDNAELDWVRTGLMALIARMLEERGVSVVADDSVARLAGDSPVEELMDPRGDFQKSLTLTTSATHSLGARLEREQGLFRLTYNLAGSGGRPETRTIVGDEPAVLAKELVEVVATLITRGAPELERMEFVSTDEFLNEAYARAMSLQYEGRYEEAQRMFRVIIEQEPSLFWPRYEYALTARNLRDFDAAERMFVELRAEAHESGNASQAAAVNNSLGVLYMGRRRNDEAREAFEQTIVYAGEADRPRYEAVARQNLGLLAKNRGDLEGARVHLESAIEIYEQMDIGLTPGQLHNNYSGLLLQQGHIKEAEQHSLKAVENFRLTNQRLYESYALSRLANVYRRQGLLDDAEDAQQRAMAVRTELGDRKGIGSSLVSLSSIAFDRGDLTRSIQYGQQARDLGADIDDPDILVGAMFRIAKAELYLENYDTALKLYADIETAARNVEDELNVFAARYGAAQVSVESGNLDNAAAMAHELLNHTRERNQQRQEAGVMILLSDVHRARGEWQESIQSLEQVRAISIELGDLQTQSRAEIGLARSNIEIGELDAASGFLDSAMALRADHPDILRARAQLASAHGDAAEAVRLMRLARTGAGEGWRSQDVATLEAYERAAAD